MSLRHLLNNIPKGFLNKSAFIQTLDIFALSVPIGHIAEIQKELKNSHSDVLINIPKVKGILQPKDHHPIDSDWLKEKKVDMEENMEGKEDRRLLLLNHEIKNPMEKLKSFQKLLNKTMTNIVSFQLTLDYDYWSTDDILETLLPNELEKITSFETIGHIAHLNLTLDHMPFKQVIGQVILDKNPNIKTVVTKIGQIENVFRVFDMEVIAGLPQFITTVTQNGCRFTFDYAKVYWNSRLESEHARLVSLFAKDDLICDVFAGVGPFSIPAAKKGCSVYANDLNPNSFEALNENIKLNKIPPDRLRTFNMDGHRFIKESIRIINDSIADGKCHFFDHYIMNLPSSSIEFLTSFSGIANDSQIENLPFVHCYLFAKTDQDPIKIIETQLDWTWGEEKPSVHHVRKVAPNKEMFCVSFRMPGQILRGKTSHAIEDEDPGKKRLKIAKTN